LLGLAEGGVSVAQPVAELFHRFDDLAGGGALLLGGETHLDGGVGDAFEQAEPPAASFLAPFSMAMTVALVLVVPIVSRLRRRPG